MACPLTAAPPLPVLDVVGDCTTTSTNCSESTPPFSALTNPMAAIRNDGGCVDTDNNASDFSIGPPVPRNSASPVHVCACAN